VPLHDEDVAHPEGCLMLAIAKAATKCLHPDVVKGVKARMYLLTASGKSDRDGQYTTQLRFTCPGILLDFTRAVYFRNYVANVINDEDIRDRDHTRCK
jgi:hypothetical protein